MSNVDFAAARLVSFFINKTDFANQVTEKRSRVRSSKSKLEFKLVGPHFFINETEYHCLTKLFIRLICHESGRKKF